MARDQRDHYYRLAKQEGYRARSAYKLAYEKTDAKSMYRNLIEMKLDALGEAK